MRTNLQTNLPRKAQVSAEGAGVEVARGLTAEVEAQVAIVTDQDEAADGEAAVAVAEIETTTVVVGTIVITEGAVEKDMSGKNTFRRRKNWEVFALSALMTCRDSSETGLLFFFFPQESKKPRKRRRIRCPSEESKTMVARSFCICRLVLIKSSSAGERRSCCCCCSSCRSQSAA